MKLLQNMSLVRVYLISGFSWVTLTALTFVITKVQPYALIPGSDSFFSYGYLRPIFTSALIFGALGSLFFAGLYQTFANEKKQDWLIISRIAFVIHQLILVSGIALIFFGANQGREYGEFPWFIEKLFCLVFTLHLIFVIKNVAEELSVTHAFALTILLGNLLIMLLGNVELPYSPISSVSFYTGVQDAALQEFYRTGLVVFFVYLPAFYLLYSFMPDYYGVGIYYKPFALMALGLSVLTAPIAGMGNLWGSPAPAILQTVGISASLALAVALLMSVISLQKSLSASGHDFHSNSLGLLMRWGLFFIGVVVVFYGVLSFPFLQERFGYGPVNIRDIAVPAIFSLGTIVISVSTLVAQQNADRNGTSMIGLAAFLNILGLGLTLIGQGFEAWSAGKVVGALADDGSLAVASWSSVLTASSFASENASILFRFLLSWSGLAFVGTVCVTIGLLLSSINGFIILFGSGEKYTKPNLQLAGTKA